MSHEPSSMWWPFYQNVVLGPCVLYLSTGYNMNYVGTCSRLPYITTLTHPSMALFDGSFDVWFD